MEKSRIYESAIPGTTLVLKGGSADITELTAALMTGENDYLTGPKALKTAKNLIKLGFNATHLSAVMAKHNLTPQEAVSFLKDPQNKQQVLALVGPDTDGQNWWDN